MKKNTVKVTYDIERKDRELVAKVKSELGMTGSDFIRRAINVYYQQLVKEGKIK